MEPISQASNWKKTNKVYYEWGSPHFSCATSTNIIIENPAECQHLITVLQNPLLQYLEVRWQDETESPLTTEHLWSDHVYYLYPLHAVFLKLYPFHFVQL